MKNRTALAENNCSAAHERWGDLPARMLDSLRELTEKYGFIVALGDLYYLNDNWYVSHAGLLRLSRRCRCQGIHVAPVRKFCDPTASRWAFRATVYKSQRCKGFAGYGDADPSNVSPLVRGAEMRIAETRAVNRALRKAYGIGLCSVEEIGSLSGPIEARNSIGLKPKEHSKNNGDLPGNGQPLLRDRLCLLIRQHNLDAAQVKRYAAEFCHVQSLRDASRDQIEEFIQHLSNLAAEGRDKLLQELEPQAGNAAQPTEAA